MLRFGGCRGLIVSVEQRPETLFVSRTGTKLREPYTANGDLSKRYEAVLRHADRGVFTPPFRRDFDTPFRPERRRGVTSTVTKARERKVGD